MVFLDRLKALNPLRRIDDKLRESVEDKAHAATLAVSQDIAKLSPELADLLGGEPVVLKIEVTLQLKQKGE